MLNCRSCVDERCHIERFSSWNLHWQHWKLHYTQVRPLIFHLMMADGVVLPMGSLSWTLQPLENENSAVWTWTNGKRSSQLFLFSLCKPKSICISWQSGGGNFNGQILLNDKCNAFTFDWACSKSHQSGRVFLTAAFIIQMEQTCFSCFRGEMLNKSIRVGGSRTRKVNGNFFNKINFNSIKTIKSW